MKEWTALLSFVRMILSQLQPSKRTEFNNRIITLAINDQGPLRLILPLWTLSQMCYLCRGKYNRGSETCRTWFNFISGVCSSPTGNRLTETCGWPAGVSSEFTCTYGALVTDTHCCTRLTVVTQNTAQHLLQNAGFKVMMAWLGDAGLLRSPLSKQDSL